MTVPSTSDLANKVPRPPDLWRAWEETTTYLAGLMHHEISLHLAWSTGGMDAPWMAQLNWPEHLERVAGQPSAGVALTRLWQRIAAHHQLFPSEEDARRAPRDYDPEHWFRAQEEAILGRILGLIQNDCDQYQTLLITHSTAASDLRLTTARLICHTHNLTLTGQGESLLRACQDLYPRIMRQMKR
ncbi:MAG: hypothetical protein Kow0077_05820 [Anaerolineae bacterium]